MNTIVTFKLNAVSIYLMEICKSELDYLPFLNGEEAQKLQTIKHPLKRKEYAATRFLKHSLFGKQQISYDTSGSPLIENAGHISISHSKRFVAIGVCADFQIGIDIEPIQNKAMLLSSKFIHPSEKQWFDTSDEVAMTSLWSLKESLYKLSDRKQLIFKDDLSVYRKENQLFGSVLTQDGIVEYPMSIEQYQDILITCNTRTGKKIS